MQSRVKAVQGELWDDMHLRGVQLAGNKVFFEYMKEFKLMDELTSVEIDKRFKHEAVRYYVRRLAAQVQE